MVEANSRIGSAPDPAIRLDTRLEIQSLAGHHDEPPASYLSWSTWANVMPSLAREGPFATGCLSDARRTAGGGGASTDNAEQAMLLQLKSADRNLGETQLEQSEPHDTRWDHLLNSTAIDRCHSDDTDGQGHQLFERSMDEVHNIEVRDGHHEGDRPANYIIDKDGKVHELIPPNKKAMGEGDDTIVIEFDDSGSAQVQTMNDLQRSAANALISQIQADAAQAGIAPDIPDSILHMLVAREVPTPRAVSRHVGGGMMASPGGGNGGLAPQQGSYERPPIPNRAPQGEVHQRVEPTNVKFDPSTIHDPAVRAIVDKVVAKNEGHPNSINWNDNGYGISVGIFQWNQKAGELPMLFKAMWDDPAAKQAMIANFGKDVATKLGTDESFVRRADFSPNNDLGAHLQATLNDKAVQNVEVQLASNKVLHLQQVANAKGIHSGAAIGLYVDLVNQLGEGGAAKYLNQAAAAGGGETDKYQTLLVCSSENRWRKTRNQTVDREIKEAKLSLTDFSINA